MALSYAVLGTGALGGYYGGLLARAGFEVHFLARSDAEHLRRYGLRVDSKLGDFHVARVNAYPTAEALPVCDVTIVALKSTQNSHLKSLLPSPTGTRGVALVLQNGLHPEMDAASVIGTDRVLGGCCFLCCNKRGPGWIQHLDYGPITMGEHRPADIRPTGISDRLRAIANDFRNAGIPVQEVEDLWSARWTKLIWNVPFNGLSVVLSATTDQILRDAEPLVRSLMREVAESAAACGRPLGHEVIEQMIENTRNMVPYQSSMQLDWEHQRPMEIEAIFGAIVRAAETHHCPTPRIRMLYEQLAFLQSRLLNSAGHGRTTP